jgi:hypothetical protein
MSSFADTLASFCVELTATFPELETAIRHAATKVTPAIFWSGWRGHLEILRARDFAALQAARRGLLVGPVVLTPTLWGELSAATQGAIWRYLRTLALEAAMEGAEIDDAAMGVLMDILMEERGSSEAEAEVAEAVMDEARENLNPLLERLRGMMAAAAADASGGAATDASGVSFPPLPEIPDRLKNGRIARLAQDLARQFNPAEFGIDPAMLTGDDPMVVLQRLAELYQRDPSQMIRGAQQMAERIKRQILGGSLDRDGLIAEAREFVELFRDHPLFKEPIAKFEGLMGAGGLAEMFSGSGAGAGSGSERLRRVQERLRKKTAAKAAAAGGAGKKP